MTDIVDPASLRPGDVVDVVDRLRITIKTLRDGTDMVSTVEHGDLSLDPAPYGRGWTRESHLVSRAEPERGSVWQTVFGVEFYYEPDPRWPERSWVQVSRGARIACSLADMTFVRSAAEG